MYRFYCSECGEEVKVDKLPNNDYEFLCEKCWAEIQRGYFESHYGKEVV